MPRRKRKLSWVWGLVLLGLIIVAIVVVVLVKNYVFGNEVKNDVVEQNAIDIIQKPEGEKKNEDNVKEDVAKKEEIPQYDGEDPNTSEKLSGVVSYASVNNGNLVIRVNIDQYLTSGKCNLSLIKDGISIYDMESGVETSVATATCSGFDIPVAGLGSGRVEIKIALESDGKSGIIIGEAEI